MNEIETIVPKNISITDTKGVLGTTAVTYNEAGLTYNEAGQIYGGADVLDSTVPSIIGVITPISNTQAVFIPISNNIFLEDSHGVLGTTALTYNESGITYNEASQIYGGADVLSGVIPKMIEIGILDTTTQKILQAGQPIGLLLTLTYPSAGTIS